MARFPRSEPYQTITIANGGTVSTAVDARGSIRHAIIMPAAFTGTSIHYEGSHDGVSFVDAYDQFNVQVTCTVAASRAYDVPLELAAYPYWRVVSNAAEGAARTLLVCCKN